MAWLEIDRDLHPEAYVEQTVYGWIPGKLYTFSFLAAVQYRLPRLSVQLDGVEVFRVDSFDGVEVFPGSTFASYTFKVGSQCLHGCYVCCRYFLDPESTTWVCVCVCVCACVCVCVSM